MSTVPVPQSKSGNSFVDNLFNLGFGIYAYEDFKDSADKQKRLLSTPTQTRQTPGKRTNNGIDPGALQIVSIVGALSGVALVVYLLARRK